MPRRPARQTEETFIDLHFPLAGMDLSRGYDRQPNRPVGPGDYARTTPDAENVVGHEPGTDRARGGQRSGLAKAVQGQVNGSVAIQDINSVVVTEGFVPGSATTIPVFLGYQSSALGIPRALATFNTSDGVQRDTATALSYATSFSVSARAFTSGGSNASYTSLGIADDTPVTVAVSLVTEGTELKYAHCINGRRLTSTLVAVPGTTNDLTAKWVGPSSSYHIFVVMQASGTLAAGAITDAGLIQWSNVTVCATTEPTSGGVYTLGLSSCISGTYICTFCPGLTGVVRCLLADGTSGSVITTKAAIETNAGGNYTTSNGYVSMQQIAAAGGILAVPVFGSVGGEWTGGLVFITASTGTAGAYTALTGYQTATAIPSVTSAMGARVISDGTNFYWVLYLQAGIGSYAAMVRKVSGAAGTVMWTATLNLTAGVTAMVYVAGLTELHVYGTNFSVALNATTGDVAGTGLLPDNNHYGAICDAGSVTVGVSTIGTTTAVGPVECLVAVSGGTVKVGYGGAWSSVTSGTTALNTTGVIRSTPFYGKVFFADGTNAKYWDPSDNTIKAWTATRGSVPRDSAGNYPRLLTVWRGSLVASGLPRDPRNWFISAVGDGFDWEYGTSPFKATDAIAGNNAPQGLVGDVVTGLAPYTDDVMFMGCSSSIWLFRGDPRAGGQIDLSSDKIGAAWGIAWAKDPYGTLYFVSNLGTIFRMNPTASNIPAPVSLPIDSRLRGTDLSDKIVRLQWDDREQVLRVYMTSYSASGPATHWMLEPRSGAWWPFSFEEDDHNPLCCHFFNGTPMIGSWDGYVRTFSTGSGTDDGTPITSRVVIGPILTKDFDEIMLEDLQAIMAENSGDVEYEVLVGRTAQAALEMTNPAGGTWTASRNWLDLVKRAGHALYVRVSATNPWAMEAVRARITLLGKVRRRGAY